MLIFQPVLRGGLLPAAVQRCVQLGQKRLHLLLRCTLCRGQSVVKDADLQKRAVTGQIHQLDARLIVDTVHLAAFRHLVGVHRVHPEAHSLDIARVAAPVALDLHAAVLRLHRPGVGLALGHAVQQVVKLLPAEKAPRGGLLQLAAQYGKDIVGPIAVRPIDAALHAVTVERPGHGVQAYLVAHHAGQGGPRLGRTAAHRLPVHGQRRQCQQSQAHRGNF